MRQTVTPFALIAVALSIVPVLASQPPRDSFGTRRFNEKIGSYMALRQDVERRVPAPIVSSNPAEIFANEAALAEAIRKARPHAKAGDIFVPAVSDELRWRIEQAFDAHHVSEGAFLDDIRRDSPAEAATLKVNGTFDWRYGAMTPTAIIDALPQLPWPLQYRFVCRDLVLLDVDAGLIVDVLYGALTER
jgi:hypothetical protein